MPKVVEDVLKVPEVVVEVVPNVLEVVPNVLEVVPNVLEVVPNVLEVPEVMRFVLLCMLEAVEGGLDPFTGDVGGHLAFVPEGSLGKPHAAACVSCRRQHRTCWMEEAIMLTAVGRKSCGAMVDTKDMRRFKCSKH